MGINKQSDVAASLQIGPTTGGMVRIYVANESVELPLDFDPEEAEEIAEEILAAAARARAAGAPAQPGRAARPSKPAPDQDPPKRRRGSGSSS